MTSEPLRWMVTGKVQDRRRPAPSAAAASRPDRPGLRLIRKPEPMPRNEPEQHEVGEVGQVHDVRAQPADQRQLEEQHQRAGRAAAGRPRGGPRGAGVESEGCSSRPSRERWCHSRGTGSALPAAVAGSVSASTGRRSPRGCARVRSADSTCRLSTIRPLVGDDAGALPVLPGLEDAAGVLDGLLGRRERRVGALDLAGVDEGLAVEAHLAGPGGTRPGSRRCPCTSL